MTGGRVVQSSSSCFARLEYASVMYIQLWTKFSADASVPTDETWGDETETEGETDGGEWGVWASPRRCHSGSAQPLIGREGWKLCMCSDGLRFSPAFGFNERTMARGRGSRIMKTAITHTHTHTTKKLHQYLTKFAQESLLENESESTNKTSKYLFIYIYHLCWRQTFSHF